MTTPNRRRTIALQSGLASGYVANAARNYGASLSQAARAFARLASVARRGYLHKAIRQSGLAKDQKAELHRVANEQLDELEREGRLLRTGSSDER